jgi:rhodanese-related sulfurtransferase
VKNESKMKTLICLMMCLLIGTTIAQKSPSRVLETVDKSRIEAEIKSGNVLIIDVRTPQEFKGGHLEDAVNINAYDKDFIQQINALDRNKKIIVYCAVGGRSKGALKQMEQLGFNYVLEMKGGYNAWLAN